MKQWKRKPQGAAVREKESRARAAESSRTAREGGVLTTQIPERRKKGKSPGTTTGHCVSAASHQFMTKVHDWFALLCSKHTFKLMLETVHSRFPYPEERQRERDRVIY